MKKSRRKKERWPLNGGYPRGWVLLESRQRPQSATERVFLEHDSVEAVAGHDHGSHVFTRSGACLDVIESPGVALERMMEARIGTPPREGRDYGGSRFFEERAFR